MMKSMQMLFFLCFRAPTLFDPSNYGSVFVKATNRKIGYEIIFLKSMQMLLGLGFCVWSLDVVLLVGIDMAPTRAEPLILFKIHFLFSILKPFLAMLPRNEND